MDHWSEAEGGGYFYQDEDAPAQGTKTSAARQQFLCPVTVRQVLEAPEEGLKVGSLTATTVRDIPYFVSLLGVVSDIEISSTNIKFSLTDDTGSIDCLEWLETEDNEKPKPVSDLVEKSYYHVYGCTKSPQGRQRIMVFKTAPVKNFNEVTIFMLEVLNLSEYGEKDTKVPKESTVIPNDLNSHNTINKIAFDDNKTAFTPVQKFVLDAIKGNATQVGWSKHDPAARKKFPSKHIQEALDFLVSEGHIYTTVDDDHYSST